MTDKVTSQSADNHVLHGNLGATGDFWFLVNGNIPDRQIVVRGQNEEADRRLAEAEGRAGAFPTITVAGRFTEEVSVSDSLRRFVVARCAPHSAIAERAFAIFASGTGGTAEQNWLLAERDLLGL